jgi:hypothetical protein
VFIQRRNIFQEKLRRLAQAESQQFSSTDNPEDVLQAFLRSMPTGTQARLPGGPTGGSRGVHSLSDSQSLAADTAFRPGPRMDKQY